MVWLMRLRGYAERLPESVLLLLARIAVGSVFLKSGLNKLDNWDLTLALFADEYRLPLLPPDLAAPIGTFFEVMAPLALFIGLAARLATLPLLAMTAAIELFVYPLNWAEHLLWATVLLWILARGPGLFSLDTLIERKFPIPRD